MKIKVTEKPYDQVLALKPEPPFRPKRPSFLLATLVRALGASELKAVHFTYREIGMERLGKKEPALFLMNHSSFIDLKIANRILYPRPYNIVCTSDGFVGKRALMRALGCIPTRKFMTDAPLVRHLLTVVRRLKSSILMFPEASYSFDGTATPLPDSLGKCLKLLGVPVVMIRTAGAFARDPLYNGLQVRDTDVSATVTYLLSPDDIRQKSVEELNATLKKEFDLDYFRWQKENGVVIDEPFRADGLNRVLYKCPCCGAEGQTEGKGITLTCHACDKVWTLEEDGTLSSVGGTPFAHIPDWYAYERAEVRRELETGIYALEEDVDILMMIDTRSIYRVGSGHLSHSAAGFHLSGCDGRLQVTVPARAMYSLYADYFWYEIGDMVCIGDEKALYYCFPKSGRDIAAKSRLATEELYKLINRTTIEKP